MKIYSKKAYRFSLFNGPERVKSVDVPRNIITPVPDWVENDPMFNAALKAGNISIIGTAGNSSLDAVAAVLNEAKELEIQNPGTMTLDQIQQTIADIKQDNENTPVAGGSRQSRGPSKAELVAEAFVLGIDTENKLHKMNIPQLQEAIAARKATMNPPDNKTDDKQPGDGESGEGGTDKPPENSENKTE